MSDKTPLTLLLCSPSIHLIDEFVPKARAFKTSHRSLTPNVHFPEDVSADLLPTAGADVVIANLQGDDLRASRRMSTRITDGENIPVGREIHSPPEIIIRVLP